MQKIGLGEVTWKVVAKNLRSLKVNVRKLVSMKNSELENWYQKLLIRKIGICEKIQSWKIGIKHSKSEN